MITVSRRILVSAPQGSVQRYLSDLQEIAKYEPKVDSIDVASTDAGQQASVTGRFLGLPWSGTFRFEMTRDGGYRGVMVNGPLRRIESRVLLRPVIGGTLVEHQQVYEVPFFMRPLKPFVTRWLDSTIENGLGYIKEGAEALNRRLQIQGLEA
ncbi:MAG: hypothetical protein A2506_07405 [Elusimicrobia bacterium RIFOXYD12_FULL_66_9]|nr:MAG: hypothetical protein A2506_07405 [Elusimicrobia bacterium RIFOXYD12_FULL_66_9]